MEKQYPAITKWEGWNELEEEWWTPVEETNDNWKTDRLPKFVDWLKGRKEKHIVVVGHDVFFRPLTQGLEMKPAEHM